jgi:hypothetical protein
MEDLHHIDKQSDKNRPIGIPDVNDSSASHVNATKLSSVFGGYIYMGPP